MIELVNVTKFFKLKGKKVKYVLKDVSLKIPDRKNLAILGPNGAGKSTLLALIGGSDIPNSGKIIKEGNISWPLGLSAGFQGSLTGRENLVFVCRINGLNRKEITQVIKEVEEFSELGDFIDMPVKTYSSGMRARLGFALSIAFDFDVYLIDELTSVGDKIFRQRAQAEFERIRDNASLIYVSHNLDSLRASCSSAIFLRNGKITYYEDIEDGISDYEAYIEKHGGAPQKKQPPQPLLDHTKPPAESPETTANETGRREPPKPSTLDTTAKQGDQPNKSISSNPSKDNQEQSS